MKKTITILFLAANPKNTTKLRLDEEIREIDQALRLSEYRDNSKKARFRERFV